MKQHKIFEKHLQAAVAFHGHLCPGQIIGVRLAMLGLKLTDIVDPFGADRKKLMVFVEIARCAADAIMTVTGSRVGRRSFRIIDNGKVAATFLNLKTGAAVRIFCRADAATKASALYPELDEKAAQLQAYREMTDADLFKTQQVGVTLHCEDMPGPSLHRVRCEGCGEAVLDQREVLSKGRTLCRTCAEESAYYYTLDHHPHYDFITKAVGQ